jgi:hypothetical protein
MGSLFYSSYIYLRLFTFYSFIYSFCVFWRYLCTARLQTSRNVDSLLKNGELVLFFVYLLKIIYFLFTYIFVNLFIFCTGRYSTHVNNAPTLFGRCLLSATCFGPMYRLSSFIKLQMQKENCSSRCCLY